MNSERPYRRVMTVFAIVMMAIRIYYQRKSQKEGGEFELREGRVSLFFASVAALMNIVFGLAFLIRPQAWRWSYFHLPNWLRWLGVPILAAGQLLLWLAHHHLAANFSGVVGLREEQKLVQSGPYSEIRHPIYTAYLMNYIGGGLLASSWVLTFIPAAFYSIMVWIRMPQEELLMLDAFGEEYGDYYLRTSRLLPRI